MQRSRRVRAGWVAAVLAAPLLLAVLPAAAHAADVAVQNGTLRYASGQAANSVQISLHPSGSFVVSDSKTNVNAGSGCTSMGARRATCSVGGRDGTGGRRVRRGRPRVHQRGYLHSCDDYRRRGE